MCEPGDTEWLEDFYLRIMNQTDPLTLYAKASKPRPVKKPTERYTYYQSTLDNTGDDVFNLGEIPLKMYKTKNYTDHENAEKHKKSLNSIGCITFLLCAFILIIAVILLYEYK